MQKPAITGSGGGGYCGAQPGQERKLFQESIRNLVLSLPTSLFLAGIEMARHVQTWFRLYGEAH